MGRTLDDGERTAFGVADGTWRRRNLHPSNTGETVCWQGCDSPMSARTTGGAVQFILFSSSFCGSCRRTRQILDTAARLVPEIEVIELNVADEPEIAEHEAIASTPTVILRDATGTQIFRSAGVPNLNQVLAVAARGLDSNER